MNFDLGGTKSDPEPSNRTRRQDKTRTNKSNKLVNLQPEDSFDRDEPVFVRGPAKIVTIDEPPPDRVTEPVPVAQTSRDPQPEPTNPTELSPRQKMLLIPRAHMTKAEKKRLQWELENEAMEKLRLENEERVKRLTGATRKQDNTTADNSGSTKPADKAPRIKEERSKKVKQSPSKKSTSGARPGDQPLTREQMREAVKFVEPDFVPGLGDISGNPSNAEQPAPVRGEPVLQRQPPQAPVTQAAPPPSQQQIPVMLSKAEQKRLQWNKERGKCLSFNNSNKVTSINV